MLRDTIAPVRLPAFGNLAFAYLVNELGNWLGEIALAVLVYDATGSTLATAGLFISVLSGKLSGDAENLVRVLAENGRLDVLAEIRTQYEALRNEREGVVEAEVYTAFDLEDAQLADLVARLEKKTGRKVKASVRVDKDLIAGVKVVLGDKVIDGSARAQLGALENALKA